MKLCAVVLLLLPLTCVSFSPPRTPKTISTKISSEDEPSVEDAELVLNDSDTDVTPQQQDQPEVKERPVVILVKGRRKKKNKRPIKALCRKGVKSRKCKRWARKQARRQRRIRRRLAAAAKRVHLRPNRKVSPVTPPPLAVLCRKLNRRGIEDSALRCAETNNIDVDTFMDFVLLVFSNSSINGQEEAYPEDEEEQIKNILLCLGQRKRWHRTSDLDEVLAELRMKRSFFSIESCVEDYGRNCSWNEEEASGWLDCVNFRCKEQNGQHPTTRLRSGVPEAVNESVDRPVLTTVEPSDEEDDLDNDLTEELPYEKIEHYNVGPKEEPEIDYDYEYDNNQMPDIDRLLEQEEEYEDETEQEEDYEQWLDD